jgi:hypothetical protein
VNHLAEQANLDEPRKYRIEQSCAKRQINERLAPDYDIQATDEIGDAIHLLKTGLRVLPENSLDPIDDYLHAFPPDFFF